MKKPLMVGMIAAVLVSGTVALVASSCRTTQGQSGLRGAAPGAAAAGPSADQEIGWVAVNNCKSCHHSGQFYPKWMAKWSADTAGATTCLNNANDIGATMTCLEAQDANGTSSIGIWRAYLKSAEVAGWVAAAKPGMAAADVAALDARYQALTDNVAMTPKNGATDAQLKALIAWIASKTPEFFKATPEPAVTAASAGPCVPDVTAVRSHLLNPDGTLNGLWAKKDLQELGMKMFACGPGDAQTSCFTDRAKFPPYLVQGSGDIRSPAAAAARVSLLRLKDLNTKNTAFWTRSSADGRFVGNGVIGTRTPPPAGAGTGTDAAAGTSTHDLFGMVDDLQKGVTIRVEAAYDPGFSPDGKWFTFHGLHQGNGGVLFCPTSLLQGNVTAFDPGTNPRCLTQEKMGTVKIDEYHTIATALNQPVEFISQGTWENDNGGNATQGVYNGSRVINAQTAFGENTLNIYTLDQDTQKVALAKAFPALTNQGDFVISPSTRMVLGRFGDPLGTTMSGYKIHLLSAAFAGSTVSDITDTDGGTICSTDAAGKLVFGSAKTQYSFDERFVVTHNYNPRYKPANSDDMREGQSSSDVWIYDLLTGKSMQVTATPPGVYALYPHFRADGWLYFLLRDRTACAGGGNCPDSVVATDVALILGKEPF